MGLGLFQKDVARIIGVTTDTVTNWEKNRVLPALRVLPRVLELLGYDPCQKDDSIAGQLTGARGSQGLSQKKLAEILLVNPCTPSKWEIGNRIPRGLYFQRVRLFLDSL